LDAVEAVRISAVVWVVLAALTAVGGFDFGTSGVFGDAQGLPPVFGVAVGFA